MVEQFRALEPRRQSRCSTKCFISPGLHRVTRGVKAQRGQGQTCGLVQVFCRELEHGVRCIGMFEEVLNHSVGLSLAYCSALRIVARLQRRPHTDVHLAERGCWHDKCTCKTANVHSCQPPHCCILGLKVLSRIGMSPRHSLVE